MIVFNILCIFIFVQSIRGEQGHLPKIYDTENYAKQVQTLTDIMTKYYETSVVRISETLEMRFMYEESPHYEQGYILGEIIERYRKTVEHVQRSTETKANTVMDDLKRTELLQKLHFEVYHLCNMMHEIALKYENTLEFGSSTSNMDLSELYDLQHNLKMLQKQKQREKRKRLKLHRKLKDMMDHFNKQSFSKKGPNYNKWWPIDYGWEIDYKW